MSAQALAPTQNNEIHISDIEQFYYDDLLNELKTDQTYNKSLLGIEKWIQSNYSFFGAWKNPNKVKLAVQRLIANYCYANYQHFLKIYVSPISSDIAFETKDAIINIDSKTVSETGNKGDFRSLFFSPNQASFNHKGFGNALSSSNTYPGMPINFAIPPIDPSTKKPILTFFIMYKYFDNGTSFSWFRNEEEPNVKFICIPNGDLSNLFNNDLGIKGAKTFIYEKIANPLGGNDIFHTLPLSHKFSKNSFKVEVGDRVGWYVPNNNETWLPYPTKKPKEFRRTLSAGTCRIQFSNLKTRYDSKNNTWDAVNTWQI